MNLNLQEITLDVNDHHSYEYLFAKQYDVGRKYLVNITKDGDSYDISNTNASIYVKKPDGKIVINQCVISGTNQVMVTLSYQMTTVYGNAPFQIVFTDNENVISTVSGRFNIEKSTVQNGDIESSDDISIIDSLILQTEEIRQLELANANAIKLIANEWITYNSTPPSSADDNDFWTEFIN